MNSSLTSRRHFRSRRPNAKQSLRGAIESVAQTPNYRDIHAADPNCLRSIRMCTVCCRCRVPARHRSDLPIILIALASMGVEFCTDIERKCPKDFAVQSDRLLRLLGVPANEKDEKWNLGLTLVDELFNLRPKQRRRLPQAYWTPSTVSRKPSVQGPSTDCRSWTLSPAAQSICPKLQRDS